MFIKKKTVLLSSTTFKKKIKDGIYYYTRSIFDNLDNTYNLKKITFNSKYNFWTRYPYSYYAVANLLTSVNFKLKSKIDLIHTTDHRFIYSKSIPTINTIHDVIPLENPEWEKNFLRNKFYKNIFLKGIQSSDQIITVSNFSANKLNLLGVKSNKINVIYNTPRKFFLQKKFFKYKREKYILFVGTISPRKNLFRVLKAFMLLDKMTFKDYKLIVIGKINYINREEKLLLNKLIILNKVSYFSNASDKLLLDFYQKSEILLFPSLSEGFGYPILEAFATKLPVITSKFGATKEIAGNAALFIDPSKINEIKNSIIELITNQKLKTFLINKGYERLSFFSKKKFIHETNKVYKKVII
tara:strand:+ start:149 stop:1216 length:1068 start_codon:yes stop_codon:yes gene_type:complete